MRSLASSMSPVALWASQEAESVTESIAEVGYARGAALLAAAVRGGDVDISYHDWLLLVGDGDS